MSIEKRLGSLKRKDLPPALRTALDQVKHSKQEARKAGYPKGAYANYFFKARELVGLGRDVFANRRHKIIAPFIEAGATHVHVGVTGQRLHFVRSLANKSQTYSSILGLKKGNKGPMRAPIFTATSRS